MIISNLVSRIQDMTLNRDSRFLMVDESMTIKILPDFKSVATQSDLAEALLSLFQLNRKPYSIG